MCYATDESFCPELMKTDVLANKHGKRWAPIQEDKVSQVDMKIFYNTEISPNASCKVLENPCGS